MVLPLLWYTCSKCIHDRRDRRPPWAPFTATTAIRAAGAERRASDDDDDDDDEREGEGEGERERERE